MLFTIALVLIIIYLVIKIVPIFSSWLGTANTAVNEAREGKEWFKEKILSEYASFEDFKKRHQLNDDLSGDGLKLIESFFRQRDSDLTKKKILANYSSFEDFKANFYQFNQLTDSAKAKMKNLFEERNGISIKNKILANYSSYEDFKTNFCQFDQLTNNARIKMMKMFADQ